MKPSTVPAFSPHIEAVLIGSNEQEYKLEVTVNNPLGTDLLVTTVSLEATKSDPHAPSVSIFK